MILDNTFSLFAILIILCTIPLYIYKDQIKKIFTRKSDFEYFLYETQKYLEKNHPKIPFSLRITQKIKDETHLKTKEILIIEDILHEFLSYEFDFPNNLSIPSSYLWANYRENCHPYKTKFPTDLARRKELALKRDNKACLRCGKPLDIKTAQLVLLKPIEQGGGYNFENLLILCNDCKKILHSDDPQKSSRYYEISDGLLAKVTKKED